MTDISRHPLLRQCYELCGAIEACGASPELTEAVTKASELMESIDEFLGPQGRPTLEEYFKDCFEADPVIIDHALRASVTPTGDIGFYIHPQGRDGETRDFAVRGNHLVPLE